MNLNDNGFNLFSALVAAMFLMIGVLMVNMLIDTEEKISSEVYLMTNNFSLSDAASIARADALQSFNYNFRESLEEYLTINDDEMSEGLTFNLINTADLDSTDHWAKLTQNFESAILHSGSRVVDENGDETERDNFEAVIDYVAEKTITQFHDGRYGRYHVSLSDRSETSMAAVRDGMNNAIKEFEDEGGEFLQIVGCKADDCPVGTFYFTIPLNKMKDDFYEQLPRIVVKDLISGEEIKISLLPKSSLSVYIPLRFFKAIHEAQANAFAVKDVYDMINGANGASLGYCDYGCEPRTDPLSSGGNPWDKSCKGNAGSDVFQDLSPDYLGQNAYLITTTQIARTALRAFTMFKVCKAGEFEVGSDVYYDNNDTFSNYSLMYNGLESTGGINSYPGCAFDRITAATTPYPTKTVTGGATSGKLQCSSIKTIEASVLFEDTNPLYIVSGELNRYRIGIHTPPLPVKNTDLGQCTSGGNSCTSSTP